MNKKGVINLQTRIVILLLGVFIIIVLNKVSITNENIRVHVVRENFKIFTLGSEMMYRVCPEIARHSDNETEIKENINSYLTEEEKFDITGKGMEDPWGIPYEIEINSNDNKIYFKSIHNNKVRYVAITQYLDNEIRTCTYGFEKGKGEEIGNATEDYTKLKCFK